MTLNRIPLAARFLHSMFVIRNSSFAILFSLFTLHTSHSAHAQCQTLQWTLNNPTPEGADYFGTSVAISEDYVVVGAWGDKTGAENTGSVYLYDLETSALLLTLSNPTPDSADLFGVSVAISENNVLVGSPRDDTRAEDAGIAYLFDAATGSRLRTFNNPTPVAGDYFGASVAISGNNVLVGATGDNTGADNAGSAYLFNCPNAAGD